MLALAVIALVSFTSTHAFNVTDLIVPEIVSPKQETVEIECRYEGNFTVFMFFKDRKEFFRYIPAAIPSISTFPLIGVGTVEVLFCGPVSCRLKLGALTEHAAGSYKCDIERQIPPYKFASRIANMRVSGHIERKPLVEGLAPEFGEGDEMQAYCRATPGSELRWYINGQEEDKMRGSAALKLKSTRQMFLEVPPTVTVQCAEYKYERLLRSEYVKATWKPCYGENCDEMEQKNQSHSLVICLHLVCVLCLTSMNLV